MCGIIAIINNKIINKNKFIDLLSKLQHRGQESFGISFLQNNNKIITNSYLGKIKDNDIPFFYSKLIIGHTRYSTSGKSKTNNRIKQLLYTDENNNNNEINNENNNEINNENNNEINNENNKNNHKINKDLINNQDNKSDYDSNNDTASENLYECISDEETTSSDNYLDNNSDNYLDNNSDNNSDDNSDNNSDNNCDNNSDNNSINSLNYNKNIKNDTYFKVNEYTESNSISSLDSLKDDIEKNDNNNIINNSVINKPIQQSIHKESQPFTGVHPILGKFSLVHNGNIPYNSENKDIVDSCINTKLYNNYLNSNNIDSNNIDIISDTHMIVKFIENFDFIKYKYIYNKRQYWDTNPIINYNKRWKIILIEILKIFKKAYCLIILTNKFIYTVRDKYGVRPLCIGYNESGWCISSESTVFNNEYNFIRDVKPGEILQINENGINTMYIYENERENILNIPIKSHCLFEYIYFLKEDTFADNFHVSNLRYKFGVELANQDIENKNIIKDAIVVGSPSTGIPSGKGYADTMNLQYIQVLKKDNNIGRTFILENNKKRDNACKKKYYLDTQKIKNNKIIIVDDSLVRGTTIKNLITIFRESGATEVNIRIAAPPIKNPCYYGIDIPTKEELIANNYRVEKIKDIINANSLSYLSMDSIRKIMENHFGNMCTGCFDGNYNNFDW